MITKPFSLILLLAIIFGTACQETEQKVTKKRPNILFIMSDDHAYQAISAYSNHLTETPNIDRIAKEGMLFTNACNVTFPQLLQDAGYQTAMFGKLHFGNNPKGFDEFQILPGQGHYYNPDFITKKNGKIRETGYTTDIITDKTLNWLKTERKEEDPFFLMYLHKAPHREWLPPERHYKNFTQKTFPEPETLFDNYEGRGSAAKEAEMNLLTHMNWAGDSKIKPELMDELGIPETAKWDKGAYKRTVGRLNPEQKAKWDAVYDPINEDFKKRFPTMTEKDKMSWRYQRYMQDYLGSIAAVDDGVGEVLDYLEASGLAENTIVVYTSDQGFYLGEHGWFDKRFIYNESFKTPFMVRWPGVIQPNQTNTTMVQNLDFAQTFLDAAGVEAPNDMQGESLVPLFKGKAENFREAVYYHYYEYPSVHMVKRHYAIVTEDYKLAHFYFDVDEWELYDRKKDKNEMTNVYDDPEYAEIVADLKDKLAKMRIKYKDSAELDQQYIDKYTEIMKGNQWWK